MGKVDSNRRPCGTWACAGGSCTMGDLPALEDVVNFYNTDVQDSANLDAGLKDPLQLNLTSYAGRGFGGVSEYVDGQHVFDELVVFESVHYVVWRL